MGLPVFKAAGRAELRIELFYVSVYALESYKSALIDVLSLTKMQESVSVDFITTLNAPVNVIDVVFILFA
jgi:hypothetical protein